MADPARWLDVEAAARYVSLRADAFMRKVRAGVIPAASRGLGDRTPRWDRLKLDTIFDGGTASTDPRIAVQALADKEAAKGRANRQSHSC